METHGSYINQGRDKQETWISNLLKINKFHSKSKKKILKVYRFTQLASRVTDWELLVYTIIPVAIYVENIWSLKEEGNKKLSLFENSCLKTIEVASQINHIKMENIRKALNSK